MKLFGPGPLGRERAGIPRGSMWSRPILDVLSLGPITTEDESSWLLGRPGETKGGLWEVWTLLVRTVHLACEDSAWVERVG